MMWEFQILFPRRSGRGYGRQDPGQCRNSGGQVCAGDSILWPERKGAPVFTYARISDTPIDVKAYVYRPNCVIDFDPSLKELGIDSAEGARPGATLVVNTNDASYVNEAFGHVTRIDADKITHELLGEVPPNVAMLGALAKATDCVSLDSLRKAVQMKIPGKAGEMNAETCAAAYRNA